MHNKALVRTQTTLRFVCAAQLGRYPLIINARDNNERFQKFHVQPDKEKI